MIRELVVYAGVNGMLYTFNMPPEYQEMVLRMLDRCLSPDAPPTSD